LNVNRRTALGVLGAIGSATLASNAAGATRADNLPPVFAPPNMPVHGGVQGRMTGAKAAVAALRAECVPCVFGVPGAQNNELWDAMKTLSLPYLLVTNESSASVMADAAARVTGGVGVFSVVPGPGLTNAMTGIGEALYDSVPIVGIVTDVDRRPGAKIGQVHGLNNAALLRPICKAVLEVQHQGQIAPTIHQAFRLARCGEPGPVAVVIPYPLLTEVWDYDCPVPPPPALVFDERGYRQALCALSDRRTRVGIYAGLGCMDVGPSLAALADVLQAPVATSVSGKGAIPENHPLSVGWGYGKQATRAAEKTFAKDVDIVLAVGVRYSEVSTANYAIPERHKIIHVDANPQNVGRNVPAAVGVNSDSRLFIDRLLADAPAIRRAPDARLRKAICVRREQDRTENSTPQIHAGVDPMVFLVNLRRLLGPDGLVVIDVSASTHWASEGIEVWGPRRYITPANNQSMGWAIPAAIGAQRVRMDQQVVAVTGDGCFLMSGLEASTAARACLPVKFFVLDDGAYHYMQMLQIPTFRRTTATEIARIDFAALAQGLSLGYNCIPHNNDIQSGIARALAMPGPVLTRVIVSYEGREIRWLNALKDSYIDNLSGGQKARMVTRIAARSLKRHPDSD
jgi:acetolactate synthase-1/2/3 large subunit